MKMHTFKIVVIGHERIGKTSIALRYVENIFNDKTQQTINATYLQKVQQTQDKNKVKLAIWDTAGQQKYKSLAPVYYRDAHAALIVYDITNKESLVRAQNWIQQLQQVGPENILLILVGNKSDLESSRKVGKEQVQALAKRYKAKSMMVSAKNGNNIKQLFSQIATYLFKSVQKDSHKSDKKRLKIDYSQKKPAQKNKCC